MTRFYTRSGDDGYTGLLGKGRVPKHHPRTEAIGALDEATAALGAARAFARHPQTGKTLLTCQRDMYWIMAEVAATEETTAQFQKVNQEHIAWLEEMIDELTEKVQIPKEFIISGDSQAGSLLSLARAVVRRSERRVAGLFHEGYLANPVILSYLNRLSSLCFVLELAENQAAGFDSPTLAKTSSPQ